MIFQDGTETWSAVVKFDRPSDTVSVAIMKNGVNDRAVAHRGIRLATESEDACERRMYKECHDLIQSGEAHRLLMEHNEAVRHD